MNDVAMSFFENYTPVGDVLVLTTCVIFVILIMAAYVNRTRGFRIFQWMLAALITAAVANLVFESLVQGGAGAPRVLLYTLRVLNHAALYGYFFLYVLYVAEQMHLGIRESRHYIAVGALAWVALSANEIAGMIYQLRGHLELGRIIYASFSSFAVGYVFFVGLIMYMALRYRGRIYQQVLRGIFASCIISVLLIIGQAVHRQLSFTTASFLFPLLALLYLVHSNPYDLEIGAINAVGFADYINDCRAHRRELLMMSLQLPDFEADGKNYPPEIHSTIREFAGSYFRSALLFRVSNGRMILTVEAAKNPNYEKSVQEILKDFQAAHKKYQLSHKIVILKTGGELGADCDYVRLIGFVESRMQPNSIHRLGAQDIERYQSYRYILEQMEDIDAKGDMHDERVWVYCQPVLNLRTGRYDTGEALMRLHLEKKPLVMPEWFIPIAEEHGFITTLSMIILTKTCEAIRRMLDAGCEMERISVNFSMLDLREPKFSERVTEIIRKSGVPFEKIAIELTESQNERDFMLVQERIHELRESGVKFYLDDFGTGYSNFERIMELPFDIIKFDRSLVIASGERQETKTMVSSLAHMFSDMGYSVLFEGVQSKDDEQRCADMSARYLQGNRYSLPVPIDEMPKFFNPAS